MNIGRYVLLQSADTRGGGYGVYDRKTGRMMATGIPDKALAEHLVVSIQMAYQDGAHAVWNGEER